MTLTKTFRTIAIGCSLFAAALLIDGWLQVGFVVNDAQARIGRPLTPLSYAGVARRTTRRVIRRSTIYAATLPRGCTTVVVNGATMHLCSGTYYQPYQGQYVVVYVN